MSNSGSGFSTADTLRVAIRLPLLVAVIAELSDGTDDERALAAELSAELPGVVLANVASHHDKRDGDE